MSDVDLLIVGGGPAGIGPLVCAAQANELDALLDQRVMLVERASRLGAGALDGYAIDSDTVSDALLECLASPGAAHFASLASRAEVDAVRARSGSNLPLRTLAGFMSALGDTVESWLERAPTASRVRASLRSLREVDGAIEAELADGDSTRRVVARAVVLALGGHVDDVAIAHAPIAEAGSLRSIGAHVIGADRLLRGDLAEMLARAKGASAEHPVVIVGSSHSAFTVACLVLRTLGSQIEEGGVQIVARRVPKLFFPSAAAARDAGYTAFDARDVCPTTGRVFRFAGLRYDCRALAMCTLGLAAADPRVRFAPLHASSTEALRARLAAARFVVPAFGYRPRTVPLVDARGARVALASDSGAAHVDSACRVRRADGEPIARLFGIGLASGFVPHGALGGEPSFRGQTNGLWLYQNGVGRIVLDGVRRTWGPQ